jgi:hypothetical protein
LFDFTFYECIDRDNRTVPITEWDAFVLAFDIWPERILNDTPAPLQTPLDVPSVAPLTSPGKGKGTGPREESPETPENIAASFPTKRG